MPEEKYAIALRGITKRFGSVVANNNVDLSVKRGEILALLGENGAGKTTLMNMLSGIYQPDAGSISVDGQEVTILSPEDAKLLGIGMVHQHFKLVENFTAADNIWMGSEEDRGIFLSDERYDIIRSMAESFGFDLDPRKKVSDMAVSEKQTVEILKVLHYGADILILDEPTAVLTLQETQKLFGILRRMRAAGKAIIIITHKLNEVMDISDRVTILRKGQTVGTVKTSETGIAELTNRMVGHQVELSIDRPICPQGEALLELENVSVVGDEGALVVENVSFAVHAGEILGVAGVAGCGQKELCEAIVGLQKLQSGTVCYRGEHIEGESPRSIIQRGISMSFIPEDRLGMGLAASLSIADNMMLKNYIQPKGPFVDRKTARATANQVVQDLEVVTPGIDIPVRRLSGGNVQKVLLGREIKSGPNVIITAYPVRGLDINSSYVIYNTLNEEKQKGTGILFVGEDLDVMLELCDRILVLCHGRVTGIVKASQTSKEELGMLMTDAHHAPSAPQEAAAAPAEHTPAKEPHAPQKHKRAAAQKPPLVRMVKRSDLPSWKAGLYYLLAVLAAVCVGGILVAALGVNPLTYYKTMIVGCFNNKIYFAGFFRILIPLTITALGIAYAFKMRFWNIGANGQFIVGSISAATMALLLPATTPQWLTLLLATLAGAIGGGLFGLLPAVCKVRFGTNETLLTLMLNYIAFYVLTYLKNLMFYRKLSATGELVRPDFKVLPENAWMYQFKLFGVSVDFSLVVMLVLVVLTYVYFRSTKQGFEITVVGDSQNTARYAGMNVERIILRTMFLSAAVVGVAGALQVTGSATGHMLSDNIHSDVGWTGIIVAWLAKLNPIAILIVSVLMSILQKGAAVAESSLAISSAASDILEGVILFTILAADFFLQYRLVLRRKEVK